MCYAVRIIETATDGSTLEHTKYFQVSSVESLAQPLSDHLKTLNLKHDTHIVIYHCRVIESYNRSPISLN